MQSIAHCVMHFLSKFSRKLDLFIAIFMKIGLFCPNFYKNGTFLSKFSQKWDLYIPSFTKMGPFCPNFTKMGPFCHNIHVNRIFLLKFSQKWDFFIPIFMKMGPFYWFFKLDALTNWFILSGYPIRLTRYSTPLLVFLFFLSFISKI